MHQLVTKGFSTLFSVVSYSPRFLTASTPIGYDRRSFRSVQRSICIIYISPPVLPNLCHAFLLYENKIFLEKPRVRFISSTTAQNQNPNKINYDIHYVPKSCDFSLAFITSRTQRQKQNILYNVSLQTVQAK